MLNIALRTLRARWATFAGSFVALALGVGLIATMGLALAATLNAPHRAPERFAAAPVVVRGTDTLRVTTAHGVREKRLDRPRPVPAATAAALARLGRTVQDRTFPVRADGTPAGTVGHAWSAAAFTPYRLTAGRAPATPGEIVTTGGWAAPGARVTLHTPDGVSAARTVVGTVVRTVVGTAPDSGFEDPGFEDPGFEDPGFEDPGFEDPGFEHAGFEHAVFFTDAEAARLAPRIDTVVVYADPAAVRASAPGDLDVLTGDDRRRADPDPDRDSEALTTVNALLGTAGGVTGFVSVFVVASTFAFAVAQRRREFALLRAAGAAPRQLRRLVIVEAAVVGAVASAAGCVLGRFGAPRLAAWLVDADIAPSWFAIGGDAWPYWTAFGTGLGVALAGAWAASRRAGRVGPMEALREASVDRRTMTAGRWVAGGGLLLLGLGLLVRQVLTDPSDALHRKTYTTQPMLLITAFALLAPVVVGPLTKALAWLPARLPGIAGRLVRENVLAGVRRTAAVAAPVLITVALAGSLLGVTATVNAAKAAETRAQSAADFVVTSDAGGLDAATVARVRALPGLDAAAIAPTTVYRLEDGVALVKDEARAVDPAALAAVTNLPVTAGKVTDLDDRSIVVNEEWPQHTVGSQVDVWLGDGRRTSLRIAAVLRTGTGGNGAYVTPLNAPGAAPDRIDVRLRAGTDAGRAGTDAGRAAGAAAALRAAVAPGGGHVLSKEQWLAVSYPATSRQTRIGTLLVLGIALLYSCIALANTLVMATADRVRDLAVLRLAGATLGQVLRLVAAEALLIVAVGTTLGAGVAALNLLGVKAALAALSVPSSPVVIPWTATGAAVAVCALLAVPAAVIPARLALRGRAVGLVGGRE
ncbi:ABC transporter permease [Streptomyces sp. H39-C1]|uniref:ABC transporter permease n=1 Tax=Streptomyces sp. H39-C1 TaxID=3004355 RepID=UPI0022AFB5F1|nr:ABC transporter permease [Streptomyces sp. H39-C1]MCZ4102888.1 FtsX-like permease family protein [Streptomyces sp. H39-C1]